MYWVWPSIAAGTGLSNDAIMKCVAEGARRRLARTLSKARCRNVFVPSSLSNNPPFACLLGFLASYPAAPRTHTPYAPLPERPAREALLGTHHQRAARSPWPGFGQAAGFLTSDLSGAEDVMCSTAVAPYPPSPPDLVRYDRPGGIVAAML